MQQDIRWQQRLSNYLEALQNLTEAVELSQQRPLSKLEQQGLIQGFEMTHELAWNLLKDYLTEKGFVGLVGSRDATRVAFKNHLIQQGEDWMDMITDRNLTSHTYNKEAAQAVAEDIIQRFYVAFKQLADTFIALRDQLDSHP